MKIRFFYRLVAFIFISIYAHVIVLCQPPHSPQEEALKLTQMLVRELNITDSIQRDTLYRLHLKYAILRQKSNTRQENLDRLLLFDKELKTILTAEQYKQFMNNQINGFPRTCNSKHLHYAQPNEQ